MWILTARAAGKGATRSAVTWSYTAPMKMATASAVSAALEKEHLEATKVKNTILHSNRKFRHRYELAWYYSPYRDDFSGLERLYLLEFCLKYARRPVPALNYCNIMRAGNCAS